MRRQQRDNNQDDDDNDYDNNDYDNNNKNEKNKLKLLSSVNSKPQRVSTQILSPRCYTAFTVPVVYSML